MTARYTTGSDVSVGASETNLMFLKQWAKYFTGAFEVPFDKTESGALGYSAKAPGRCGGTEQVLQQVL